MRCVVFAYHDVGYVCLEELLRLGAEISLVITHEDDPEENIWFRSVADLCCRYALPVFAPRNVNTETWIQRVTACRPHFLFSFYYRKILCRELLEIPARGALNLHGSLLPRYRGRCPVNWAIIHDEKETGMTLHYMVEEPDAGDIVAQRAVPIDDSDTAFSVYGKLTEIAPLLLRETYPLLCAGNAPRIPQDHTKATYFGGRRPQDGRIDWRRSARDIFNLVRAVTRPYPGAFTFWDGRELKVWKASIVEPWAERAAPGVVLGTAPVLLVQCGNGALALDEVQFGSGQPSPGSVWASQYGVGEGGQLG